MEKRNLKQGFIIFVYLLVLAGIVWWIYAAVRQEPTCQDGLQNQGEVGVDCGGPCSLCEFQTIKNLETQMVKFVPAGNLVYGAVALLQNPNPNYGAGEFGYRFSLYDQNGRALSQKDGRTFVLPNQKKYIIEPKIKTVEKVASIDFSFSAPDWQKIDNFSGAGLLIRGKRFESQNSELGTAKALGIVKNSSPYDWAQVQINILLFAQSREIIGLGKTQVNSLLSGEEREFIATWFSDFSQPVFDTEMVAETNVFADDNFMRNFGGGEKFQEF